MSESASHELDLPLLSNNEDINVYHYVMELHCHFEKKQFEGNITIFCKPVKKGTTDSPKLRGENLQTGCPHLDHQYASKFSITTEEIPNQHTCSDNPDSGYMSAELTTEYPRCYEAKVLASESMGGTMHVPSQNIYKDKAYKSIQPAESISHLSGCCEDNALSVGETKSQHPSYQDHHTVLDVGKEHAMLQYPLSEKENATGTHCHGIGETNVKADDKNDVLPTDSARSLQDKTHITENPVLSTDSSHLNESSKCFEHARFKESGNKIDDFEMILDCWELTVERVEEVNVSGGLEDINNINKYDLTTSDDTYRTFLSWSKCEGKELDYRTDKQCVKIRKKGVKNAHEFPRVVRLFYRTHPKGHSLKWTKDQDGRYANFLLTRCMLGIFYRFLFIVCRHLSQHYPFPEILPGTLSECQKVGPSVGHDLGQHCSQKLDEQTTKVVTSKEKAKVIQIEYITSDIGGKQVKSLFNCVPFHNGNFS